MGNYWYKLTSDLENNNLALYNYLQDYYDHKDNKYTFIVPLSECDNYLTLNDVAISYLLNKKVIELKINIYNNTRVIIELSDSFYCKTGVDRYQPSQKSFDLISNMHWFNDFNNYNIETGIDINIDDISYKFIDFLLNNKKSDKLLPLFRLLCFIKNIDETKFI
jgi:hypothetical protein